mmetsp:Transcript_54537/g.128069  ORF Transcript_54537/g.128069 Transcript_54537/m.128069 type:complete len:91 (+) Transcript_54537:264-536(+)
MGSDGVTQDFEKARELYQKAADLGDAYAMFELATMYYKGQGVDTDKQEALKLYEKAVETTAKAVSRRIVTRAVHGSPGTVSRSARSSDFS